MAPKTMPDGTPITPLPMKKIMALVICSMTWYGLRFALPRRHHVLLHLLER